MHMHLAAGVYSVVTCITNGLQKIKSFMNVHCVLINLYSSFSADIGRAIGISVSPVLAVLLVIIVMVMAFLLWKKGSKYIHVQY